MDGKAAEGKDAVKPAALNSTDDPLLSTDRPKVPPVPAAAPAHTTDGSQPARVAPTAAPKEDDVADTSTGRQEPAVRLEWGTSAVAKLGVPTDSTLTVQNISTTPIQQVLVRVRLPEGLRAAGTEPKGIVDGNVLVWELGTLQPRQQRTLQIRMVAEARGDLTPQAWVTFTGSAVTRIKVRQPRLTVRTKAPEKLMVGDPANVVVTISNPGDGSADSVRVRATLSEGLDNARGRKIEFEIGNLGAGESREVVLNCGARSPGRQSCEVVAEAEGNVTGREASTITVLAPSIQVQATGPALRYVGRPASYTLKVTNPGDMPAANVSISDVVPEGLKVIKTTHGGRFDPATHTISWFVGEVPAGQSREVQVEVQAAGCGDHRQKITVSGARGLRAEAEALTHVEGLSALQVSLTDGDPAIEVGSETTYEVRLSNTGSKPETDIRLVATIPDKMAFRSATGGNCRLNGQTLVFEPLATLAPQGEAVYQIHVKAGQTGTVRFKIQVTSMSLTEPVIKMEATRIYADTPN
jgi:uncharacterized repeat protein (TIGR01451 family)